MKTNNETYFCPSCGLLNHTHIIETIDLGGEYKDCCSCERCDNIFYVIVHVEDYTPLSS